MPSRCFVAIPLPDPIRDVLARGRHALLETSPVWAQEKWVSRPLLHVTVAFLGAVAGGDLDDLVSQLQDVAATHEPFELRLCGAQAVPSSAHASMLWGVFDGDISATTDLRDETLRAARLPADERVFKPHVTLVRARRPRRIQHPALAAIDQVCAAAGKSGDGRVSVPSLTLYSSTLGPTGPAYRALATIQLGARATSPHRG